MADRTSPRASARPPDEPSRAAARAPSSRARRRPGRARTRSGARTRGGSRGSRRTRPPARRPRAPASRVARVKIGATRLEHALVATSRTSAWVKLKVGRPRGARRRPDQLPAHERLQLRVEDLGVAARRPARAGRRGRTSCRSPRRRRATARSPGSRRSTRAASSAWMVGGSESGRSARRRGPIVALQLTLVDEHAHELLDEQRIALGARETSSSVRGHAVVPEQVLDEQPAVVAAERLQLQPRCVAAEAGLTSRRSLGPSATMSTGTSSSDAGDVLDQVEEDRLRPVDVLEDDHERAFGRGRRQQRPHAQEVSSGVAADSDHPTAPATRSTITPRPRRPPARGRARTAPRRGRAVGAARRPP